MFKIKYLIIALSLILVTPLVKAQAKKKQLVSFSGIVLEKQTLQPVPFTAIIVKDTYHGTICDYSGYYSFVAQPGDTIMFSAVGFQLSPYIIPDTLSTDRYSLIHLMDKDTTMLKEVKIYPWPSPESFKRTFLALDLPNSDMDRAKRNLALAAKKAQMEGFPIDPQSSFMSTMQEENNKLYYAGQLPPNNLLNPVAWGQFIQAWKDGDLKVQ